MSVNIVSDILDRAISTFVAPITSRLPHIKRVFLARMNIEETDRDLTIRYRTVAGDTYNSVANAHFVEPTVLVRKNAKKEIDEELSANKRIRIKIKQRKVAFDAIDHAEVGEEVYLVVETENLRTDDNGDPRKLKVQLMNGPSSVLGAADSAIEITHEGKQKDELVIEVGQFLSGSDFINKSEFQDFAIARITLAGTRESKKQWLQDIGNIADENARHAPIYFKVDAHRINTDIPEILFSYYGEEDGVQESDKFWYGDGRFFELENSGAPWMQKAVDDGRLFNGALETDDVVKRRANEHYFPICGRGLSIPNMWCAAFVSYMLYQSNYPGHLKTGSVSFSNSRKMVQIDRPVYGAISVWQNLVKSTDVAAFNARGLEGLTARTTRIAGSEYRKINRGHIGLVFGVRVDRSDDERTSMAKENHYLILGGNQKDRLMVREYDCSGTAYNHNIARNFPGKRKHVGFFIPWDYALSMQDGLDRATTNIKGRIHWLHDHTYGSFEAANLAATGLAMDARGANVDT